MRARSLALSAVFLVGGILNGQTIQQRLAWARSTIDAHAAMGFRDPPGRLSNTTWQVTRIEGCLVELKQTWRREPADVDVTRDKAQPAAEKVVSYAVDLRDLQPRYVGADTSAGLPRLTIFAGGDVFHLTTNFTQATAGEAKSWSVSGNARNLWMYFDSPSADNTALVKRLRNDLRGAIRQCRREAEIEPGK